MGIFDTIQIDFKISDWMPNAPFSDAEIKKILFQSKDLICCMNEYYIDMSGYIWDIGVDEHLPISEPLKTQLYSVSNKYSLHDGSILTIPFSGVVNLYSSNDEYSWIEFIANFHHSKLESFHLLSLTERA